METILIPAEQVKVAAEADVCVIGGSWHRRIRGRSAPPGSAPG